MLRAGLAPSFETGVAAYEVGAALAQEQLALGHSVTAEAANYMEVGRDVWRRAARPLDAPIRVIHIECSDRGAHEQRLRLTDMHRSARLRLTMPHRHRPRGVSRSRGTRSASARQARQLHPRPRHGTSCHAVVAGQHRLLRARPR